MFSSSPTLFHNRNISPRRAPVTFNVRKGDSLRELLDMVRPAEACVYWYFGPHGLKKGAVDFYKDAVTHNLNNGATPFLVDLTAWGAFNGRGKVSGYHESADSLNGDRIKTLKCSDFFSQLSKVQQDHSVFNMISDIIARENLLSPSSPFDEINFTLGQVFGNNCPSIEPIYDLDCAKSYSIIQYIELLFLTEMVLLKQKNIETIKFLLPNDEAKYYQSSIAEDLSDFLHARNVLFQTLNIEVQCFPYGDELSHRPYNCPSRTIPGKKKLNSSAIINESALLKNDERTGLTRLSRNG